ncbi:MAG TPA: serine/threonine-protein kinase [Oligoflexia bacterium]|nr:serine/threonine-protein kinase [Oligoflexia bacterium]HMP48366.1 serine/threonine-protein kinase [Oligoflexia bacterium]
MKQSTATQLNLQAAYFDDRYELDTSIGRGRGSIVYRARRVGKTNSSTDAESSLALKVLLGIHKNPQQSINRIKREARALLACVSPSIIRIFDYVAREDICYISMEYAEFGDLKHLFDREDTILSYQAILKLVQGILNGVQTIHSAGIIHRDLKPENFLLMKDYQVKIGDFGICLLPGEKGLQAIPDGVVGTFDYAAPESLKGSGYSRLSDLYSVGISAFELLAGYLPFSDKTLAASIKNKTSGKIKELPEDLVETYPQIIRFFRYALAPNPSERYQSAEEMAEAIEKMLLGQGQSETPCRTQPPQSDQADTPRRDFSNQADAYTDDPVKSKNDDSIQLINRAINSLSFSTLGKAFIISVIAGIISGIFSPYFLNLREGKSNQTKTDIADIKNKFGQNEKQLIVLENFLTHSRGVGTLHDLYTPGRTYYFSITPGENGKSLFSLSVKNWAPVEIDPINLLKNDFLEIKGKGILIRLKLEHIEYPHISGTYENLITGKDGSWYFQNINEK